MYFPQEQLCGDEGVLSGALGDISKHFKDLRTFSALLLPRASPSKRCRTGIISTSQGNNMMINTYFSCFWTESSSRRHLVLFCSYENQTSGDSWLLL